MGESIIDIFKVIYVQQGDGERVLKALSTLKLLGELKIQPATICNARQAVLPRHLFENLRIQITLHLLHLRASEYLSDTLL